MDVSWWSLKPEPDKEIPDRFLPPTLLWERQTGEESRRVSFFSLTFGSFPSVSSCLLWHSKSCPEQQQGLMV